MHSDEMIKWSLLVKALRLRGIRLEHPEKYSVEELQDIIRKSRDW